MRSAVPGLDAPDPVLERDVRARLEEVEAALERCTPTRRCWPRPPGTSSRRGQAVPSDARAALGVLRDPSDHDPRGGRDRLVHAATLYHDDAIDEAESRHGVPSVNARWDNTVAILTGDYLFARASESPSDLGADAIALLARTIATLCDGQMPRSRPRATWTRPARPTSR